MYAYRALCLNKHTNKTKSLPVIILKTLTSCPELNHQLQSKPSLLHVFQEAVGFRETTHEDIESQDNEIKKNLWDLEREVKGLKETGSSTVNFKKTQKPIDLHKFEETEKPISLYKLFSRKSEKEVRVERVEKQLLKELSEEMEMVVRHFYKEGYFSDANFVRGRELDFCFFGESFGRDYIKFAADKFGKDHQEIAKWLSGSDLKRLALFGCPSLEKKNVFSAKRLRKFFHIEESTVCTKCALKPTCKFANQNVWGETKSLPLSAVMRVLILYDLEEIHPKLTVPDEIKASVSKLLKEVLRLSQTVSHRNLPTSNQMD